MFSGLLIPNNCVEGLGEGLAKLVQSRPQKTPRRPKKIQSVDPQLQLGSIFDLKAHELLIRCRWGSGSNRGRVESIGRRGFWEWRRHRKRRVEWGNRKWRWARPGSGGCVGATGTRGHDGKWFHFLKTGSQHKKNTASNSFYLDKTGTDSAHCSETLDKKRRNHKMNDLPVHYFLYHYWNKKKSRRERAWSWFFYLGDLHCLITHKNYSVNRKSIYRSVIAQPFVI